MIAALSACPVCGRPTASRHDLLAECVPALRDDAHRARAEVERLRAVIARRDRGDPDSVEAAELRTLECDRDVALNVLAIVLLEFHSMAVTLDRCEADRRCYACALSLPGESARPALSLEAVEDYIRALPWSPDTGDEARTLVAGNVRGFADHLRRSTRRR